MILAVYALQLLITGAITPTTGSMNVMAIYRQLTSWPLNADSMLRPWQRCDRLKFE
jgi:hypothetical protein